MDCVILSLVILLIVWSLVLGGGTAHGTKRDLRSNLILRSQQGGGSVTAIVCSIVHAVSR